MKSTKEKRNHDNDEKRDVIDDGRSLFVMEATLDTDEDKSQFTFMFLGEGLTAVG